jgi:hypothetical protein
LLSKVNKIRQEILNPKVFEKSTAGKCKKTSRGYWAFVPNPLPPIINYNRNLALLLSEADRFLGELSGTGRIKN